MNRIDLTPQNVADAGQVLKHTAFVHRRTAIRPKSEKEAQEIAIVWARMFARYKLDLPELLEAVERRAIKHQDAPEPGEIVQWAREVRQEWSSRAQADPEQRALHEAKIDRKIANFAGNFGIQIDGRPA
ncbi:hypothetical protein [Gordonia westfalica]|uniref:Uncharacterized protein n=1 Tax=Gordonia westfalica TaxID=158898 RepID=A0A1H2DR37_9ACTN|nr:hypothetical protein [Gordonia westfalica]SDT84490.1 hypothetical protein SAMN04488548_10923 [Gordonia westfalica]SDT84500.1 hypothetical protein SAMN04488548_10928 [Gordonia westfalica]SDT85325.1 hypothetical protein SAMN04488548_11847 [Gordonia westfalica]SDT89443.1 hypothetical protein SAMN04488548_12738 [Gordonia westfalica]